MSTGVRSRGVLGLHVRGRDATWGALSGGLQELSRREERVLEAAVTRGQFLLKARCQSDRLSICQEEGELRGRASGAGR